jgi:AraC-like DNA-binding protein
LKTLDKYLENIRVEVEPFALCMIDSGWKLTLPGPPVAMLHFVTQGDGWIIDPNGQRTPISANTLAIVPIGMGHSFDTGDDDEELVIDSPPVEPPVHRIVAGSSGSPELIVACGTLKVHYGSAKGLFDHLREMLVVDMSSEPEIPLLFQGILAEQSNIAPGHTVLQGALMTQLLVLMLRKLWKKGEHRLPWLNALDDPRLGQAIEHVMKDPSAPYTVESLAEMSNMSRSTFAEHFVTAFGLSPMHFVNQVRMEMAVNLLNTSGLPIDRVAERVGYASRSHFSQAFKKHTGHSPAQYRRS